MIFIILHGLSMALADSVPGVSGGTIAFIMGFYERFLTALHNFFGKDRALRKEAFFYLIKFAVGWCLGMGSSVLLLSHVFESNIYFLSSLFLGLTLAAIPFIIYEEKDTVKGRYGNLIFTLLGAALVVCLTAFRAHSADIGSINFLDLNVLQYGYLIFCGVMTILAMLLPGVSGSTLLLIFGVYIPAINAVKQILHMNFRYLPGILALAAGALLGIVFVSKLIRKCLSRFRPQMVYLILGLMVGSLYAIVMGPTTLEAPQAPVSLHSFHIIGFLLGILILAGLEALRKWAEKKR